MLLTVSSVINNDQLAEVSRRLSATAWRDGSATAGGVASRVKRNQQADLSSRTGVHVREALRAAITSHEVIRAAARPARYSHLMVSKTEAGGGYGRHIDNAFMGVGEDRLRTDISFTLFLSDPADYEGGALRIEHSGASQDIKLAAGDLVLYPSTALHEVRPVTAGTRVVCVGWIESQVRDPQNREILFDLQNLRAELAHTHDGNSPEMLILSKTMANLLRRWS